MKIITPLDFSNWIIYVTVKLVEPDFESDSNFSNWIIYVTVKLDIPKDFARDYFSNWIIYVTVKHRFECLN